MFTPEKIEEWIKEAQARPESALRIIRLIAERLQELTSCNEELLADNIALRSEKQVEEYKKRIAHLEYQLNLLRRGSMDQEEFPLEQSYQPSQRKKGNLLVYDSSGHVLRISLPEDLLSNLQLTTLDRKQALEDETVRMLVVPEDEELLFLFSSGRVSVLPLDHTLPVITAGKNICLSWDDAIIPREPQPDDILVCICPFSRLPLAENFLQISRRGCVKKTLTSLAQSVLSNHYIGKGVCQKADQAFEICLSNDDDLLLMTSREGFTLCLDVGTLSYTAEERIRLVATDHIVSAFVARPGASLFFLTQSGKIVHRTSDLLSPATSPRSRGQALLSEKRRQQGIRIVAAANVDMGDWGVSLNAGGQIVLHKVKDLLDTGTLPTVDDLLAFTVFPGMEDQTSTSAR